MTDDALRELFAATERNGRRVPPDAEFAIEHYDACTQVSAAVDVRGHIERFAFEISHLVAIRCEDEPTERDPDDTAEQIRKSVISLAYACIDAIPQRFRSRPFAARIA